MLPDNAKYQKQIDEVNAMTADLEKRQEKIKKMEVEIKAMEEELENLSEETTEWMRETKKWHLKTEKELLEMEKNNYQRLKKSNESLVKHMESHIKNQEKLHQSIHRLVEESRNHLNRNPPYPQQNSFPQQNFFAQSSPFIHTNQHPRNTAFFQVPPVENVEEKPNLYLEAGLVLFCCAVVLLPESLLLSALFLSLAIACFYQLEGNQNQAACRF